MAASPARRTAFDILRQVERGGYASDLLRLQTGKLSARDAGLGGEIVFGVLRRQAQLDYLLRHFSGRDPGKLDLEVRLAFRIGVYQICYLDRVPRHAAVNDSVELVKRAHKRSAAGLVNAVMRKVKPGPLRWPDRETELSQPAWLLENWERLFGVDGAREVAAAFLEAPQTYIRVPAGREAEAQGLKIEKTETPGCYRLLDGPAGGFRQQDISSQAIVPLLELEPGSRLLDLCAPPGNKTAQALETPIEAVSCDISLDRLRGLRELGIPLVNLDATAVLPFRAGFDRILVDAPCSGTGTIGRNPEIKWRIQPSDLAVHHARQVRLLRNALGRLAPGGRLVYATCSLEREENEQVVEEVLREQGLGVIVERRMRRVPGAGPGDGFYAAVLVREPFQATGASPDEREDANI